VPPTDPEALVSLYNQHDRLASRTVQEIIFCTSQQFHVPVTAPLHSDSDAHELQVFWAFGTGRIASTPSAKMLCVENVLVTAEGIAFLETGECIVESIYPMTAEECKSRFPTLASHLSDPLLVQNSAKSAETIPEAIFLREPGETGFFHWVNSVLPRLAVLDRLPHLKGLPLLAYLGPKYASDSFRALGYDPIQVRSQTQPLLVHKLWIATPCIIEGDHFTRSPFWTQELRRAFKIDHNNAGSRMLYLSRSDSKVRRASNESKIIDLCMGLGADIIQTEGMSFTDQIALFRGVKLLISIHGAGLSNMAFMPHGTVAEIVSRGRLWPTYRTLAARCGLNYGAYITDFQKDQLDTAAGNEDVIVDTSKFQAFLASLQ